MIGPIFQRETATLPRRGRHFVNRVVFAMMLFAIVCTTWLLLAGIQPVQNAGDLARFGKGRKRTCTAFLHSARYAYPLTSIFGRILGKNRERFCQRPSFLSFRDDASATPDQPSFTPFPQELNSRLLTDVRKMSNANPLRNLSKTIATRS